jgi:hypothetical protein
MKAALIAAAAAALTVTISSGAAFAETARTSVWRPFDPVQTTKKVRTHRHYDHRDYRPTYRPVYRPSPVQISAAELAEKRRDAFADGRISFIEKIKLNAAQRRHEALANSYR